MSELSVDKAPQKEAWSVSHDDPFFYFDVRDHIAGTAEARVANFCIGLQVVEYIKCWPYGMINYPLIGVVRFT